MASRVPKVSVGLPVYNGERFVAETIEALLGQTFGDFELIISSNGSTDGTDKICRHYATRDDRIRFHRSERNRGTAWNFPRVFELARGRYFKWAAHDDLCAPTMLEECVRVLDEDPSVVLCMTRSAVIDDRSQLVHFAEGDYSTRGPDDEEERRLWYLGSVQPYDRYSGVLLRTKRCYEVFGLMRTREMRKSGLYRPYNGAEKVFLAEMSLMGRFHEVPEVLFWCRWHDSRFSANGSAVGQNLIVDPANSTRFAWPHQVRCGWGYLKLIVQANLGAWQRFRCCLVYLRFAMQGRKWIGIVTRLLRGESNTVAIPPGSTRGARVIIGSINQRRKGPKSA